MSATALLFDHERLQQQAVQSMFESFDRMCEGTVIVDKDARIVWINARYAARLGCDAEAVVGREIEAAIPNSLMRQVVQTGEPILLDILEANGQTFVVTRIPMRDENNQVIGAVGLALYDHYASLKPLFAKFSQLQSELVSTQRKLAEARRTKYTFSSFIGTSPPSMEVKRQARRAAQFDATVLLLGETGTGKELLAQAIHAASPRSQKPFVGINVAAIPEHLLEAEFFGVAPGAFTGADRKPRPGKFELANGGTLFLDEIGDMPLALQSKLLRVLQEQEFEALGSNQVKRIDVRVIAATSLNLNQRMADGRFRPDLYYRLNVLAITLPPLRERLSDLEALCEDILEQIARKHGQPQKEISPEALALLASCDWPGNVRELRNALEKAALLCDEVRLKPSSFSGIVPHGSQSRSGANSLPPSLVRVATTEDSQVPRGYAEALAVAERQIIRDALAAEGGHVPSAARRLGLGRATLYKKLVALGLSNH
ncbi:MAG: sigma 54-interacting transcriptional regulator [Betaproteobacteria bacterium]|nr:sigma 54-interacting transcriptional regulator [Betaproteobacteria bacterium]